MRRMRHGGHAVLGQKLLNTQHGVGRCSRKSPVMRWANTFRVFEKSSLKLNAASHNSASWHTDTDGLLEHSPSRGSLYYKGPTLQKIIPFSGDPPSYVKKIYFHYSKISNQHLLLINITT